MIRSFHKIYLSLQPLFKLQLHSSSVLLSKEILQVGVSVSEERTISSDDVKLFSKLTGDWNTVHHQGESSVVHGAFLNGLVSGLIGTKLPGPGTILLKETLRFPNCCFVGDTVIVTVTLTKIGRIVSCEFNVASKTKNTIVMEGDAKLMVKPI